MPLTLHTSSDQATLLVSLQFIGHLFQLFQALTVTPQQLFHLGTGYVTVISWGRQWLGWWIISNITDLELIWHIEIQSISPYLVLVPCWVTPLLHSVGKGHMSTTSPIPTKIMSWKLGISRLVHSLKSETRLFGCGSKGKPNPHRFRPF